MAEREKLPEQVSDAARLTYDRRIDRLEPEVDGDAADGDEAAIARRLRELRRELIAVERSRLADVRRRGEISAESMRRIEHELDLEESRLAR
jgi:CPA1 family monovalent cation:H+ antiporter